MDKIISALYLAKSNNREHMLCDLIKTALYNINQFASFESIVNHIQKTFHVTPIEYEITECIEMLVGKGDIAQQGNQYQLTESAHLQIYDLIQRSNRNSRGRQSSFIALNYKLFLLNQILNLKRLAGHVLGNLMVHSVIVLHCLLLKFHQL